MICCLAGTTAVPAKLVTKWDMKVAGAECTHLNFLQPTTIGVRSNLAVKVRRRRIARIAGYGSAVTLKKSNTHNKTLYYGVRTCVDFDQRFPIEIVD